MVEVSGVVSIVIKEGGVGVMFIGSGGVVIIGGKGGGHGGLERRWQMKV
jgi:hypothetical protein